MDRDPSFPFSFYPYSLKSSSPILVFHPPGWSVDPPITRPAPDSHHADLLLHGGDLLHQVIRESLTVARLDIRGHLLPVPRAGDDA
jgi:hypothetical protein